MKKFFDWMEEHFVPIAAKIGSQRHLVAIRDGFASITPIIMAGAFAVLFNNLGWKPYQNFMNWLLPANWKDFGGGVWNGTFAIMSLLVVFTISYHLAKSYEKDGLSAGIVSLSALLILYKPTKDGGAVPLEFLGGQGLFVALIVALVATEIFVKLAGNPKLIIKMPEGVPPAVAKSFAALLPSIIVLAITAAVKQIFGAIGIPDIHKALFSALQAPLQGVMGSLGGLLVLVLVQQFLWFFGLHGSNILAPIINAVLLPLTEANVRAFKNGVNPKHIINSQFLDSYVNMGGSGATIALLIAIFIIGRKSKSQKTIANLSMAPGMFNINEPVIFGLPIILNPIYFIPFILAPLASGVIAYVLTVIGFAPKVVVMAHWTTPPILGAIISTNSLRGGITALICMVVSIIIYMPFVRIATKKDQKNTVEVEKTHSI
ncbi:PTS sugar transporter subunit IIC [Clostridium botulinum]|uniref:PTS sugar transporter subunit IIC n=1 Tax=Clostridium botulinum TaxID=1491 RepID=UPI000472B296|nr:PTS sugar transporter subunit IIC [Clostridium botulinum]APQ75410.1 PTS system, lactose/cellobiose IIC component family protein [Clostridium botulinum]AUN00622.1 PTS lactose transporter subunit IIC [Clostridium botulinum]AUN19259.1 PTS lactose transporter subunit IIC [Clostridium botulinum]KEI74472.1 PTS lactose transporter subunit IIC [Clostridium botulinum B2 331]KEI84773.1 PTS lactose transporter subunit IIC [Clostridium botulinum B2 267]